MSRRSTIRPESFVTPSSASTSTQESATESEYAQFIAAVRERVSERVTALTAPTAPPLSYDVLYTACSCGAALPLRVQRDRARVARFALAITLGYCVAISLLGYAILFEPTLYHYAGLWSPVFIMYAALMCMLYGVPKRVRVREQRRALSPLQEDYGALLPARQEYTESVTTMRADAHQKWVNALVDTIVRGQLIAVTEERDEEWEQALEKEARSDHLIYDMHADTDSSSYDATDYSETDDYRGQ